MENSVTRAASAGRSRALAGLADGDPTNAGAES